MGVATESETREHSLNPARCALAHSIDSLGFERSDGTIRTPHEGASANHFGEIARKFHDSFLLREEFSSELDSREWQISFFASDLDKRNVATYIQKWFNHELLAALLAVGSVTRLQKCLTQIGIEDFS